MYWEIGREIPFGNTIFEMVLTSRKQSAAAFLEQTAREEVFQFTLDRKIEKKPQSVYLL
jgi:hypothetical protein